MRVSGSLKVVTDAPDLVTRVTVRASHVRTDGGDVVTTSPESIPVEGGVVDFQILPGPAVLVVEKLSGEGAPSWPIVVPDRGEDGHATLAEVVEAGEIASDTDRRVLETLALQVQRDRERAGDYASESAESADVSARNAAATAKDAEATAADRVQTGKDRVATGEDRKHVDARRTHVDEQVVHVDRQVRHTDEQVVHVDGQVAHVDGQADFVDQARNEATEAADRVGTAEEVGRRRDEAVEAASRATGAASKAEGHEQGAAAAAAAEVEKLKGDAPEAFDTLGEIARELEKNESERAALANTIGKKSDREYVDNLIAPRGNHGNIIAEVITLSRDQVHINFPEPISEEVEVTLDIVSNVAGNQALVGYKFRGPNGEKALDGMSGLTFSSSVDEPYRYVHTNEDQIGVPRNWSYSAVPDEGWTLDGLVVQSWNQGSGQVFISGLYTDIGLPPQVVTRDLNGGIAVPSVPTSGASAAAAKYVDEEVAKKADVGHAHTSGDISDAYHYLGTEAHGDRVVKSHNNGHIYMRSDPPSDDALARKAYVDAEVAKKADTGHTHAAHQITGLNAFVDERAGAVVAANGPRIVRVSALPSSPDPDVLYVVVE